MPKQPQIKIENIFEGISATQYFGSAGAYNSAIAVDPDMAVGSNTKTSGLLVPVVYEKFSGTEIDGFPNWIITNPKTNNSFIYTSAGKFHSFNSAIAMRATDEKSTALPITITGGAGNGAAYYNNYIYLAEAADITRYGGMNSGASITMTENVWTGATLGSKAALNNATYPSLRGTPIPNHPMHAHGDNALYFGDTLNGQGIIHKIRTKKVTIEGDTDDTSVYNALDLPFGFYPTDIESYNTDLVILAIQTSDTVINQGQAALFFWDTTSDSFYRRVWLPDPIATALLNINGIIYIWSGNASNGVRLSRYIGGETAQEVIYQEEGTPPFAGAVDALGSRIIWGGWTTYPAASASVFAYGSKRGDLPKGLHNIVKSTSAGATPNVFSCKFIQQASNIQPKLIIGFGDGSAKGLDKLSSTATYSSVWRSRLYNIGAKFKIKKIRMPLAAVLAANMSLTPKIYLDDGSSNVSLTEINNTNFTGKRKVIYKDPELQSCLGENNFFLELNWAGTVSLPVAFPIIIDLEPFVDEN